MSTTVEPQTTISNNNSICAFGGCRKPGAISTCARCHSVRYCNRTCQKSAWSLHKIICVDAPHHVVQTIEVNAIQQVIDNSQPGDVIEIPEGVYGDGHTWATIKINKAIHLVGAGMGKVTLDCDLEVTGTGDNPVVVSDMTFLGQVKVKEDTKYNQITFLSVEVKCPNEVSDSGGNAFVVECDGEILLYCCEIIGGSDGIVIHNRLTQMHIKQTDIQFARCRGIFANPSFIIEDSAVYSCGGYVIRGRSGWREVGNNNEIQPGPWNSYGAPYGGLF